MRRAIVGAGLLVGLVGCAGTQKVSTEALVDAQVSIRAAEEAGAAQVPEAARHLQLAKDQDRQGRELVDDGKREEAALYLQRASADAELALALAKEGPARADAQRATEQLKALQQGAPQQPAPPPAAPGTGGSGAAPQQAPQQPQAPQPAQAPQQPQAPQQAAPKP